MTKEEFFQIIKLVQVKSRTGEELSKQEKEVMKNYNQLLEQFNTDIP